MNGYFGRTLNVENQVVYSLGSWDNVTIQLSGTDGRLLQYYQMAGLEVENIFQIQALPDNKLMLAGSFSSDTLLFVNTKFPNSKSNDLFNTYTDFIATLSLPAVGTQAPPSPKPGELRIWPNPAYQYSDLYIQAPPDCGSSRSPVEVWDMAGRLAGRFALDDTSRQTMVPAGSLAPGVYRVLCRTDKQLLSAILVVP